MQTLRNFVGHTWVPGSGVAGSGRAQELVNPASEEVIAVAGAEGLDLEEALAFARREGGPAVRAATFKERGAWLGKMAAAMHAHRDELLDLALKNGGNTRSDAKFDVDGAAATFAAYAELGASLGASLGDARYLPDGETVQLGRSPRLAGRHVYSPRHGVALLINAFNFPAWGFAEKAACALLAGMPVVLKPATSTAWAAHRLFEVTCDAAPRGALSLVCGSAHALPGLLGYGDVIAFTGSSATAAGLRSLPNVISSAVRLNVEADSLNAAVLGGDVEPGSDTYGLFIRDVVREITQKSGQKCTAIRRIFAPEALVERVRDDLVERLSEIVVGDPATEKVRMGPLSTREQQRDVCAGIGALADHADVVLDGRKTSPAGGKGFFVGPTLLVARRADAAPIHDLEVFGPAATLLPSPADVAELTALVARGRGGLVCSLYTDDRDFAAGFVAGAAPHHGRIAIGSRKIADQALPPGMALPQLLHGGPGRAGDGQELGGLRGLALYGQRTAVQGDRALLEALFGKG